MGLKAGLDNWTAITIGCNGNLTRTEIEKYTEKKLIETVRYAVENSVFYNEKIKNKQINNIDDFKNIPLSTADELRERGMDFLCVKPGEISRIVTLDTSGTTGKAKRIYFTESDQMLTVDYFENGMKHIASTGEKVLILMPAKITGSIGKLLSQALKRQGINTIEYGLPELNLREKDGKTMGEINRLIDIIYDEKVDGIVALPSHMKLIGEEVIGRKNMKSNEDKPCEKRPKSKEHRLRWVLLSAEYIPQDCIDVLSAAFQCEIYEHYGMTEMGLGCAVSCGMGRGYHVRESDLYIEIINPETGEEVEDGEFGELVFTTLTRKGMPFIRYRTGDYTRWIKEACPCGSLLRRLDKVGDRNMMKGYLKGENHVGTTIVFC